MATQNTSSNSQFVLEMRFFPSKVVGHFLLYEMQEAGIFFYFDHKGDIDRQTLLKNPNEANKRLQIRIFMLF